MPFFARYLSKVTRDIDIKTCTHNEIDLTQEDHIANGQLICVHKTILNQAKPSPSLGL